MAKIITSRTFLPEIIAPGTGLSPVTDKSVIPAYNVPTIQDILDGKTYKIPGGGGDWSSGWGEDTMKSYIENADDYKRKERDLSILMKYHGHEPESGNREEWTVRIKGGTKRLNSLEAFLKFKREMKEKGQDILSVSRTRVAQNAHPVDVVATSMESTFKIEAINSYDNVMETGEGFCVAKGFFVTCAHVVKRYNKNTDRELDISDISSKIMISLVKGNKKYPASVVAISAPLDIAILKCEVDCEPLALEKEYSIAEEIFTIGSPHGFADNVSFGHIGSLNRKIYRHQGAPDYMFLDLSVFSGNSGGPVLKEDGKVVAMVTAIVAGEGEYGLNAGLPSTYIEQFCVDNKIL